jgi:hypothetical protein
MPWIGRLLAHLRTGHKLAAFKKAGAELKHQFLVELKEESRGFYRNRSGRTAGNRTTRGYGARKRPGASACRSGALLTSS